MALKNLTVQTATPEMNATMTRIDGITRNLDKDGLLSSDGLANGVTGDGPVVQQTGGTLTNPAITGGTVTDQTLNNPTITDQVTVPLVIGGTSATSTLKLRSTSGVGASGADIIFQVGNNGATEAVRIINAGQMILNGSSARGGNGQLIETNVSAKYGGTAFITWSATADEASLNTFMRSKSAAIGTHAAPASGDVLGSNLFRGSDGNSAFLNACQIKGVADGTFSTTSSPGRLEFKTTPSGSTVGVERLRIDNAGNVGVGATAFGTSAAGVVGIADGTAPSSSPAGMVQVYSESGALKVRDSSGGISVLRILSGSATWNPGTITPGNSSNNVFTVTGAVAGDGVAYGATGADLRNHRISIVAEVIANDQVQVTITNNNTVNEVLSSATWKVWVFK